MLVIIIGLSVAPPQMLRTPSWSDKINHVLAYVAVTSWFCGLYSRDRWWRVLLALFCFGVGIEVLQAVTPFGRSAEWWDLLANAVGMAIGLAIARAGLDRWPSWVEAYWPGARRAS